MEVKINNWSQTSICLIDFFIGLGKCVVDRKTFTYSSNPSDVKTQFGLTKSGELMASMPLHKIRISGDTLTVDHANRTLILSGSQGEYHYTVPASIWDKYKSR